MTLTQGIRVTGEDAAEQVASRFDEISDRSGEIVPEMGAAQGMIELGKAQKALGGGHNPRAPAPPPIVHQGCIHA